jgi:5'-3' exonuclease
MRLHLVDGTYELFRAHFSPRPGHCTPGGQDAKATAGLASSLLALLHEREEAVSHIAVAFDHPIRSFRNDLFAGYKTEAGVPEELLAQFDLAEESARALGLVIWPMDRYECDDALATAAARFAPQVEQVRILSPDKDLGQCVRGQKVVQVYRAQQVVLDEAGVAAKQGVPPRSVPDLLALTGDAADGIPGLPGIGAKTAATLLAAYGHLEAIPADPAAWKVTVRGAAKVAATLASHRTEALLYRKLATLVTDVPLAQDLEGLHWRGVPKAAFEAFCTKLGLTSLRSRPKRWREEP